MGSEIVPETEPRAVLSLKPKVGVISETRSDCSLPFGDRLTLLVSVSCNAIEEEMRKFWAQDGVPVTRTRQAKTPPAADRHRRNPSRDKERSCARVLSEDEALSGNV